MLPRSRSGRIGLHLLSLIEVAAAVALVVALGFALAPAVIVFTAVITVLAVGWGYRRGRRLRRLLRIDPGAAQRLSDRDATRIGKLYAGLAFATMAASVIAIIAIFATHV
jgi:UPF0716 family protein affecting phage T7 exclusion